MGCCGVHIGLSREQEPRLFAAEGDDKSLFEICDDIMRNSDESHWAESDKAWDAIHRCLSDGTLNVQAGSYPLNRCIFGGRQLNSGDEYFVVHVSRKEVKDVARAVSSITQEWLRERYFSLDPQECGFEISEEDFVEYTWYWFENIRAFFQRAAANDWAVVFTVDQ